jgi:hypothetical protein
MLSFSFSIGIFPMSITNHPLRPSSFVTFTQTQVPSSIQALQCVEIHAAPAIFKDSMQSFHDALFKIAGIYPGSNSLQNNQLTLDFVDVFNASVPDTFKLSGDFVYEFLSIQDFQKPTFKIYNYNEGTDKIIKRMFEPVLTLKTSAIMLNKQMTEVAYWIKLKFDYTTIAQS